MSDNGGMILVMISMMILSSCVSASMSSGLFVGANEDWFTGQLFDWMDAGWWTDFKGWFGFSSSPPPSTTTAAPSGATTTAAPSGSEPAPDKYQPNCVYAYSGKDAKSGYMKTLCVDTKNAQTLWSWDWSPTKTLNSLRVGREVKVNLIPEKTSESTYEINGKDANKPINITDKDWNNKAVAISASYKSYDSKGNLSQVGNPRDEKSIYLYADENGHAYIGDIQSKSSGEVSKSDKTVRYTSSVRIGKNVEAFLNDGKTSRRIQGQGTKNLINLSKIGLNDKLVQVRVRRA